MKSKPIIIILGSLAILLAALGVYTNHYISRGIIDAENSNSITLKHSCYVYYQGDKIQPSAIERAMGSRNTTERIRVYAPGEEQVTKDISQISARIQQGEYSAASVLGNDFSGKDVDASAYSIETANIAVLEVKDYKTKHGRGLFEELTIGKGYKVNFDVVITFKDQARLSEDFLKIAITYPNVRVQGTYLDRNAMIPMYMGHSNNPLQNLLNKFKGLRTGTFLAVFLPLDNTQHTYSHQYFLTRKFYYKVRLPEAKQ